MNKDKRDKKFIGAQVDRELHRKIKARIAERELTMHDAIVESLVKYLGLGDTGTDTNTDTDTEIAEELIKL